MDAERAARTIRRIILEQSKRADVGHIGSALSVAEVLAVLFSGAARGAGSRDPERDRIILSKGHAALALYAALCVRGILSPEQLATYCGDNSVLGVHPEHAAPGVDFSTGSLGHGLSFGAGVALGARLRRSAARAFVLVSDAECNEGSLWEAAMFAAQHRLANLIAIVDNNGQQAFGATKEVLDLEPLEQKWAAFGWRARRVNGHDTAAIGQALAAMDPSAGAPHVLVAETVCGKGVSFMEGSIKWHYWPMNEEEYAQALREWEQAQ